MSDTLRRPGECLDDETLAAFIDGTLTPEERQLVERHIASCPDCHELFVDVVRPWPAHVREAPAPSSATATPFEPRRRLPLRLITGALAAAAAVVLAVWLPGYLERGSTSRPELRELVQAAGATRTVDGRLTGGFAWAPLDSATRSGTSRAVSPEVQIAAARLEQALQRDRTAANLAAVGAARLIVGDTRGGVAALEEATTLEPSRAEYWSDLASALLAEAEPPGHDAALPRALEAVESALARDVNLLEALFNKAVVLERLGLAEQAREAWAGYLAIEKDSRWRAEAEQRLRSLAPPPNGGAGSDAESLRRLIYGAALRAWIESSTDATKAAAAVARLRDLAAGVESQSPDTMPRDLLAALERAGVNAPRSRGSAAAAHDAFLLAQSAMDRDDFATAVEALARARPELERLRSPLLLSARYYDAVITYRRRPADALSEFTRLAQDLRHRRYPALVGRVEWMLGLVYSVIGNPRASDEHYVAAIAAFDAAVEPANAASVRNLLAVNLERRGDAYTAWSLRREALARSARPGVLLSAALAASNRGYHRASLVFTEAALAAARQADSAPNVADALRIEASIRAEIDGPAALAPLIDEARRLVASRHEPAWERVRAEIAVAVAQSVTDGQLAEGIRAANEAISHFEHTGAAGRLPQVYAVRARLHRRAGDATAARQDVQSGLGGLAVQRANLPSGSSQATFEAVEHELLEELLALAVPTEAGDDAFQLVDASRGRDVVQMRHLPVALADVRAMLPDRTALRSFFVSDEGTYVWTVMRDAQSFDRIAVDRAMLETLVLGVTPPRDDTRSAARLSELLLGHQAAAIDNIDTWVIVADGPLRAVPFARLPLPDGRLLATSASVVISPSAAAWIEAAKRGRRPPSQAAPVLVVGNPALDAHEYPTLRSLPHADAEAALVARQYSGAPALLRGPDATRAGLLREMPRVRVIHFAGHAISDPWTADASFLALAGPRPSRLTAADVRQLDLSGTDLVVLAACETAAGGGTRRLDSPLSLARAFLAAGVSQVVGSLWLADDRASRALFEVFHAEYLRSGDAARALQRAQQTLARSQDPNLSAPRQWAGFVVMVG